MLVSLSAEYSASGRLRDNVHHIQAMKLVKHGDPIANWLRGTRMLIRGLGVVIVFILLLFFLQHHKESPVRRE